MTTVKFHGYQCSRSRQMINSIISISAYQLIKWDQDVLILSFTTWISHAKTSNSARLEHLDFNLRWLSLYIRCDITQDIDKRWGINVFMPKRSNRVLNTQWSSQNLKLKRWSPLYVRTMSCPSPHTPTTKSSSSQSSQRILINPLTAHPTISSCR